MVGSMIIRYVHDSDVWSSQGLASSSRVCVMVVGSKKKMAHMHALGKSAQVGTSVHLGLPSRHSRQKHLCRSLLRNHLTDQ